MKFPFQKEGGYTVRQCFAGKSMPVGLKPVFPDRSHKALVAVAYKHFED